MEKEFHEIDENDECKRSGNEEEKRNFSISHVSGAYTQTQICNFRNSLSTVTDTFHANHTLLNNTKQSEMKFTSICFSISIYYILPTHRDDDTILFKFYFHSPQVLNDGSTMKDISWLEGSSQVAFLFWRWHDDSKFSFATLNWTISWLFYFDSFVDYKTACYTHLCTCEILYGWRGARKEKKGENGMRNVVSLILITRQIYLLATRKKDIKMRDLCQSNFNGLWFYYVYGIASYSIIRIYLRSGILHSSVPGMMPIIIK